MPAAPDGNPEGVAVDKRSGRFFVSRTGTGAIFVGTLGTTTLSPFITGVRANPAPTDPPVATGLKVRKGLLYVAGASTGQIRVYDLANPAAAPTIFETGGGFINDLDLDRDGNVFATDSTKSTIYKVTAAQVKAGSGTPEAIDSRPGSRATPGQFNLNGIVARGDGSSSFNSFTASCSRSRSTATTTMTTTAATTTATTRVPRRPPARRVTSRSRRRRREGRRRPAPRPRAPARGARLDAPHPPPPAPSSRV